MKSRPQDAKEPGGVGGWGRHLAAPLLRRVREALGHQEARNRLGNPAWLTGPCGRHLAFPEGAEKGAVEARTQPGRSESPAAAAPGGASPFGEGVPGLPAGAAGEGEGRPEHSPGPAEGDAAGREAPAPIRAPTRAAAGRTRPEETPRGRPASPAWGRGGPGSQPPRAPGGPPRHGGCAPGSASRRAGEETTGLAPAAPSPALRPPPFPAGRPRRAAPSPAFRGSGAASGPRTRRPQAARTRRCSACLFKSGSSSWPQHAGAEAQAPAPAAAPRVPAPCLPRGRWPGCSECGLVRGVGSRGATAAGESRGAEMWRRPEAHPVLNF